MFGSCSLFVWCGFFQHNANYVGTENAKIKQVMEKDNTIVGG